MKLRAAYNLIDLPDDLRQEFEQIIDRFEKSWQQGQRPDIIQFFQKVWLMRRMKWRTICGSQLIGAGNMTSSVARLPAILLSHVVTGAVSASFCFSAVACIHSVLFNFPGWFSVSLFQIFISTLGMSVFGFVIWLPAYSVQAVLFHRLLCLNCPWRMHAFLGAILQPGFVIGFCLIAWHGAGREFNCDASAVLAMVVAAAFAGGSVAMMNCRIYGVLKSLQNKMAVQVVRDCASRDPESPCDHSPRK